MEAVAKAELFRRLGYGGGFELLELALEEAGLSRPDRTHVSPAKIDAIRELLRARFVAVCSRGDCQVDAASIASGRIVVPAADQESCELCGGSANARAVDGLVRRFERAGVRRVCVVGGSPNARADLERLVGRRLDLRLVDGAAYRTRKDAAADLAWADLVVLWGGTILDHKVSTLYRGRSVITVIHRGIQHFARQVLDAMERGARRATGD